ncbi:MAG: sulfotransferase domain-containing protein [Hyphomicrobium sp.]
MAVGSKVWLASFPRSGNTFLRIVLNDVFGLSSGSVYDGEAAVFAEATGVVGHVDQRPASYHSAQNDDGKPTPVKTHDLPVDNAPAIYVVRDGRAALVSYYHYLSNYGGTTYPMSDIVSGRVWPGSWSAHYRGWNPAVRKNTLLLRYEELRDDNAAACEKIGSFLGMAPLKPFEVSFADLQKLNPRFFRSGNDGNSLAEMQPYMDLFLKHHGATMRELGYLTD